MSYVTSNEENLQPIIEAFKTLEEGEILISSGWIRSETLRKVLGSEVQRKIRAGKISLRLLVRIGAPVDIKITDPGVFSFIKNLQQSEKADVKWKYSPSHHAKVYVAGKKWAMVGSFNLTGGGFGTEEDPGSNPEAGIVTTAVKEVTSIRKRFEKMWEDALDLDQAINGFVANKSENSGFWMIGVKALPAGQFVQVFSDNGEEIVIGKIEKSYRYHREYHQVDENPLLDSDLMYYFTGKNEEQNRLNGVADSAGKTDYQLNIAQVKLMMSVRETEKGFVFNPVNIPPAVASPVFKADPILLGKLFNPENSEYAVLEENREVAVSFDDDEILSKHFAVIGATGSGKSYFVKKYITHRLRDLVKDDLRVIIVDTHGEYSRDSIDVKLKTITAKEGTALSAVPLRSIDDFKEYFGSPTSAEKKLISRALGKSVHTSKGEREDIFVRELKKDSTREAYEIMDWNMVLEDLAAECREMEKKPSNKPIMSSVWVYVNELQDLECISDKKQRELLKERLKEKVLKDIKKAVKIEDTSSPYIQGVIEAFENGYCRLETLDLVEKVKLLGFYRLDLTAVDEASVRQNIVGDLMQEVFIRAKSNMKNGGSFKTLFIVDEAQNYAAEIASGKISSKKWMKTIASEGRKFGVALLVMTQRPAYVSKDVLSQCSTQAIFRLINQGDIDQVAGTVEGVSEYDLLQLPMFTAGQALFTGVGMYMPVRVRILE